MNRHASVLLLLILLLRPAAGAEGIAANAALEYWRAYGALPRDESPAGKALELLSQHQYPFVDEQGLPALSLDGPVSEEVLACLRRAAALPACDFGGLPDGSPTIPLPHVTAVRRVADFAGLAALHACEVGKGEVAVEWLVGCAEMGLHIAGQGVSIDRLVAVSLVTSSFGKLAKLAPRLPAAVRAAAWKRLEQLRPMPPLKPVILAEIAFTRWFARQALANPAEIDRLKQVWLASPLPDDMRRQVESLDAGTFTAWADGLVAATERLAERIDGPEGWLALDDYEARLLADPVAKSLGISFRLLKKKTPSLVQQKAMMKAILLAADPVDAEALRRQASPDCPFTVTELQAGVLKLTAAPPATGITFDVGWALAGAPRVPPTPTAGRVRGGLAEMFTQISTL